MRLEHPEQGSGTDGGALKGESRLQSRCGYERLEIIIILSYWSHYQKKCYK